MLNPSVGGETGNDQTIKRCINKANHNKFGSLEIVNLYSWITSDPKELWLRHKAGLSIIHPENDDSITMTCQGRAVVLACGANAEHTRFLEVLKILRGNSVTPLCCGKTAGAPSFPLHPLAVADKITFEVW